MSNRKIDKGAQCYKKAFNDILKYKSLQIFISSIQSIKAIKQIYIISNK